MFHFPKSNGIIMLKIMCYVTGKASLHLKCSPEVQVGLREKILDVMSVLCFG